MEAGYGPKAEAAKVRHFISPFRWARGLIYALLSRSTHPMTTKVKRILLVEDSEHDIELTLAALEAHNVANQVDTARDGAEALDYLYRRGTFAGRSSESPVVILLDLKMPRVDGLEVLRQIKGDPELKKI